MNGQTGKHAPSAGLSSLVTGCIVRGLDCLPAYRTLVCATPGNANCNQLIGIEGQGVSPSRAHLFCNSPSTWPAPQNSKCFPYIRNFSPPILPCRNNENCSYFYFHTAWIVRTAAIVDRFTDVLLSASGQRFHLTQPPAYPFFVTAA